MFILHKAVDKWPTRLQLSCRPTYGPRPAPTGGSLGTAAPPSGTGPRWTDTPSQVQTCSPSVEQTPWMEALQPEREQNLFENNMTTTIFMLGLKTMLDIF